MEGLSLLVPLESHQFGRKGSREQKSPKGCRARLAQRRPGPSQTKRRPPQARATGLLAPPACHAALPKDTPCEFLEKEGGVALGMPCVLSFC